MRIALLAALLFLTHPTAAQHFDFEGPSANFGVAARAAAVLVETCPKIRAYAVDLQNLRAAWRNFGGSGDLPKLPTGQRNGVSAIVQFKWERPTLPKDIKPELFDFGLFYLVGGSRPGIIVQNRMAHWFCDKTPPANDASSFIPEQRLAPIDP